MVMFQRWLQNSFKILLALLITFNAFAVTGSANTLPYNHSELMEYEGYGKAMYETLVEETMFLTGQYAENRDYVRDSITEIQNYASFIWDEMNRIGEANSFKELLSGAGGYALTVGDWFKTRFFGGYKESHAPPPVSSFYDFSSYVDVIGYSYQELESVIGSIDVKLSLNVKKPFVIDVTAKPQATFSFSPGHKDIVLRYGGDYKTIGKDVWETHVAFHSIDGKNFEKKPLFPTGLIHESARYASGSKVKAHFTQFFYSDFYPNFSNANVNHVFNNMIISPLLTYGNIVEVSFPKDVQKSPFDEMDRVVKEKIKNVPIPEPKAYLSCPNGVKMQMTIDGSTFLDSSGQALIVQKDGTATIDSQICNLGWEKPVVKYDENNRAVVQKPDGKWQDIESGLVINGGNGNGMQCVDNGVVVPCNDIEKPDGSLLAYIKNSYEYATGLLETSVNGLKSLASGAVGITTLYRTFFGWLPGEITVLMTSGLAIMIGLRVFRK